MTDQRELDRLLDAFFVEGTDELADRVIDAALDQIDHTQQRRAVRMPWRFSTMNMLTRVAAAAVIGVLAVGGTFYLIRPGQPAVGGPSPTPGVSSSPAARLSAPASPARHRPARARPALQPAGRPRGPPPGDDRGPLPGHGHAAADGKVLVAGGVNGTGALASAELYDPGSGTWTATGSMVTPRQSHTATLLPDGKVLVAGGRRQQQRHRQQQPLASAELYDPGSGSWTATGSMLTPRQSHTATLLPDGKVLVAGGVGSDGPAGLRRAVRPQQRVLDRHREHGAGPRTYHTATLLPDGRVLVAGGASSGDSLDPLASAELYDPSSGTWTATGNMHAERAEHTATLLPDGKVLVAGGSGNEQRPRAGLRRAVRPGQRVVDRHRRHERPADLGHTATLLPDGGVLVAGGVSNAVLLACRALRPTCRVLDRHRKHG